MFGRTRRSAARWVFAPFALFTLIGVSAPLVGSNDAQNENINFTLVKSWAEKLGGELWHFGNYITRRVQVQNSFKTAQVELRDGEKLVEEMAANIKNMMEMKVSAVKRILDAAENMAVSHQNEPVPEDFIYYNSKQIHAPRQPGDPTPEPEFLAEDEPAPPVIREVVLTPNPHFHNKPVNTSFSSVHIPTNVYDRSPEVIQAIRWSENLDSIFINNYRVDPSLSWQYFGSSTGFMRHYPAMEWKAEPVDLFDCRTRAWYIEAATSPKDMIVLVDSSGSMTGQRKDIARHVVSTILDTLGNNDFVNIFTFNETVMEAVPCFENKLVQANLANVRQLKLGMESIETMGIANFSAALTKAFDILKNYRDSGGARCNQAIMLVSDGVPYNFKEIFEEHNWKNRPMIPVRVFTYLIGREVADVREVKWMACANQGYYVHLSTLAEVREQVLQYVPVMARPLVLQGDFHPVIWTPVYAEVTDPKIMDYLWERKEREEQKEIFLSHKRDSARFFQKEEQLKRFAQKQKQKADQHGGLRTYQLMTSVSMPVFDRTENANITENVLVNEAYWVTVTRETRVANLLGVAGTDVPIQDIETLMMPHQLGVNGYAFMITNNGYILIHPDLRPVFQEILKPSYNSVDMVEVELFDDDGGPREFNQDLIKMRDDILSQKNGSKSLKVKYHYDNMKRVSHTRRHYYWTGIENSPFALVIALPEFYGMKRLTLRPEDDIHRNHVKGNNASHYFRDPRLRIHPDWLYCKHHEKTFPTPEEELLYFLKRMGQPKWKWPLKPHPPEHMHCDRNLMQALVFDARVTDWFSQNITSNKEEKEKEFIQRFGITVAFMATHSGLTRWQSFPQSSPDNTEKIETSEFGDKYPRAIDEIWYRRAVEQHYLEQDSFVYSVDFDAARQISENGPSPLVTATHAVFHSVEKHTAPAAVVGFQFHYSNLHTLFTNITSSSGEQKHLKTCGSYDLDCFVLDNNGFVIVSKSSEHAGRFFGEVKPFIMKKLIDEKIYRSVHITDYQAVCFMETGSSNPAPNLLTPIIYFRHLMGYIMSYLFWVWQRMSFIESNVYGFSSVDDDDAEDSFESETESINEGGGISKIPPSKAKERDFDKSIMINRTRPTPCDQEVWLYQLHPYPDKEHSPYASAAKYCDRGYVVQPIPSSNLILVVVDIRCPEDEQKPVLQLVATPVSHNDSLPCTRANLTQLSRKQLSFCINHHPNESQIELCGKGVRMSEIKILYVLLASLLTMLSSLVIFPENLPVSSN